MAKRIYPSDELVKEHTRVRGLVRDVRDAIAALVPQCASDDDLAKEFAGIIGMCERALDPNGDASHFAQPLAASQDFDALTNDVQTSEGEG